MMRQLAYEAGKKAHSRRVPLDFGAHLFPETDILGLYTWRRGWLDAQFIATAQFN